MLHKWILLFLFYLLVSSFFLESSLINPDLAPEQLGYEDFAKGRTCFDEEKWEEAIHFLTQAVEKSYKPSFRCSNYLTDEGYESICDDFNEDIQGFETV